MKEYRKHDFFLLCRDKQNLISIIIKKSKNINIYHDRSIRNKVMGQLDSLKQKNIYQKTLELEDKFVKKINK